MKAQVMTNSVNNLEIDSDDIMNAERIKEFTNAFYINHEGTVNDEGSYGGTIGNEEPRLDLETDTVQAKTKNVSPIKRR
jgi:hypothetical protein